MTQLLIVSQQIVAANNRIQAELAAEKSAVPVNWIDAPKRIVIGHPRCCGDPPDPGQWPDPRARHWPAPVYPQKAVKAQMTGYVDFVFTVMPDGSVAHVKVSAEVPAGFGFADAASKVFPRWRFKPLMENGKAVSSVRHIRLTFKPQ